MRECRHTGNKYTARPPIMFFRTGLFSAVQLGHGDRNEQDCKGVGAPGTRRLIQLAVPLLLSGGSNYIN